MTSTEGIPADVSNNGVWARLVQWLTPTLAPVAAAGGLAYGLLLIAYSQFYAPFGVSPEQVGITKTDVLTELLVGPVVLALLWACGVAALLWGIWGIRRLANRHKAGKATQEVRGVIWRTLVFAALLGILVSVAFDLFSARAAASRVLREGQPVRSFFIDFGPIRVPLIKTTAMRVADLTWGEGEKPPPGPLEADRNCLIFLGSGGGTSYVYSTRSQVLVRFAADAATITLDVTGERLPTSCRPVGGLRRFGGI